MNSAPPPGGGIGVTMRLKSVKWLAPVVFFAGALFAAWGVYRGEAAVVLQKAVRICLECIGIG